MAATQTCILYAGRVSAQLVRPRRQHHRRITSSVCERNLAWRVSSVVPGESRSTKKDSSCIHLAFVAFFSNLADFSTSSIIQISLQIPMHQFSLLVFTFSNSLVFILATYRQAPLHFFLSFRFRVIESHSTSVLPASRNVSFLRLLVHSVQVRESDPELGRKQS